MFLPKEIMKGYREYRNIPIATEMKENDARTKNDATLRNRIVTSSSMTKI